MRNQRRVIQVGDVATLMHDGSNLKKTGRRISEPSPNQTAKVDKHGALNLKLRAFYDA